jgi:hypothetical protein
MIGSPRWRSDIEHSAEAQLSRGPALKSQIPLKAKGELMHRSRLCQFVIDVPDLDEGASFWSRALNAVDEPLPPQSSHIYRQLRLPDSDIRILLQKTSDAKVHKERMHLDLETDDMEAEIQRLEVLGATRWDHQQERGYEFWVLKDPWGNEFCVLDPHFPELLDQQEPWD